jgi:hypothetical protein
MYLIMQKIHVALSSLDLKVFVVMGKLVTVAFVAMATRNLWRFQLVTRALLLVFERSVRMIVTVPYILMLYRVITLVKEHVNQTLLY